MGIKSLRELPDDEAVQQLIAELRRLLTIAPDGGPKKVTETMISILEGNDPELKSRILEMHRKLEEIEVQKASRELKEHKPKLI